MFERKILEDFNFINSIYKLQYYSNKTSGIKFILGGRKINNHFEDYTKKTLKRFEISHQLSNHFILSCQFNFLRHELVNSNVLKHMSLDKTILRSLCV